MTYLGSSDYKIIYQVIRHFDFAKVLHVMTVLDWKMLGPGGSMSVPTLFQLQQLAFCYLEKACQESNGEGRYSTGTGPFIAHIYREGSDYTLGLDAVLASLEIETENIDDWADNPTAKEEEANATGL